MMFGFKAQKRSARKFQDDMKELWEENSESIVQLINHAITQSDSAQQWGTSLAQNQQKIANGIIFYCGERQLSSQFNELLQFVGQSIDVFVGRKEAKHLRQRWYKKADALCDTLNTISNWNVREYFYKQVSLIESLIKSFIKRDVKAIEHYRSELLKNSISLSTIFTNGIITDNSNMFY